MQLVLFSTHLMCVTPQCNLPGTKLHDPEIERQLSSLKMVHSAICPNGYFFTITGLEVTPLQAMVACNVKATLWTQRIVS